MAIEIKLNVLDYFKLKGFNIATNDNVIYRAAHKDPLLDVFKIDYFLANKFNETMNVELWNMSMPLIIVNESMCIEKLNELLNSMSPELNRLQSVCSYALSIVTYMCPITKKQALWFTFILPAETYADIDLAFEKLVELTQIFSDYILALDNNRYFNEGTVSTNFYNDEVADHYVRTLVTRNNS